MKKFKPYVSVWVYVDDFSMDSKLDEIASKYDGEAQGSGYGFGSRDRSYTFYSLELAQKFFIHVNQLKKVTKVESFVELEE